MNRPFKKHKNLIQVSGLLSAIIRSNCPLEEALNKAFLDAPNGAIRRVILSLRDDARHGRTLADSMRRLPGFFPKYFADLVEAGEKTGNIADALDELADEQLYSLELLDRLRDYALYLGIVFFMQVGLLTFYMFRINPVFLEILDDFNIEGAAVPRYFGSLMQHIERLMMTSVDFGVVFSVVVVLAIFCPLVLFKLPRVFLAGVIFGRSIIHVPVLGNLFVKKNLARVSLILSKLLAGGVPIDTSLDDISASSINPAYARAFARIRGRVDRGETFSDAVRKDSLYFPESFHSLVVVGENSGLLPDSFAKLAEFYRREVEKKILILIDLITPLFLLFLGSLSLAGGIAFFGWYTLLMDEIMSSL